MGAPFKVEPFAFEIRPEDAAELIAAVPEMANKKLRGFGYLASIGKKSVPMYVGSSSPHIAGFMKAIDQTTAANVAYNFQNDERILIFQIARPGRARRRLLELKRALKPGHGAPLAVIVFCDHLTVDAVSAELKPNFTLLRDTLE